MEWELKSAKNMSIGNPFHMESSGEVDGEGDHDLMNPFMVSPSPSPGLLEITPKSKQTRPLISPKNDRNVTVPEPANMVRWRKEREKLLKEQDAAENSRIEEMANLAKSQYDTWFDNYNSVLEKTKKANREANEQLMTIDCIEKHKVGFIDAGATIFMSKEKEELTIWERVAKLCDLSPNNRNIKSDVNRMRQLMLQLKAQKFPRPSKEQSS